MKTLTVCMGSACHLKDALGVVEIFREEIRRAGIERLVQLKGSFCLGNCGEAVMIQFEDETLGGVGRHNAAGIFRDLILPLCLKR